MIKDIIKEASAIEFIKDSFQMSFNKYRRKDFLDRSLEKIESPEELLSFFFRYINFNSVFAGGVARLAGAAHILHGSFMDSDNKLDTIIYSKSSEIASNIFAAAEDEYNADTRYDERITHCDMARFFFDSIKEYFNNLNFQFPHNIESETLNEEVMNGYCVRNIPTDDSLLGGIGFHIASEELADQEFISINSFLNSRFRGLVSFLKNKKHKSGLSAYYWVEIHCSVEKNHHDYAMKALEIAVESYSGSLTKIELQKKIEDGYQNFCLLQEKMIHYCCNG